MAVDLMALTGENSHQETKRIMQICNACRYCEGFCAVFPAMERRRTFDEGDTAFLANLCHNCGACYHACQYAPPHEFGVNVPATLATRRMQSYSDYAWPQMAASLFEKNGLFVSIAISISLALAVGLMLAMINPALFWGVHIGEGAFYNIMPHTVMAGIPLIITAYVFVAFIIGIRRYWQQTGAVWKGIPALRDAMAATATLRYLGGDNAGGSPGCPSETSTNSNRRKYYHHATFYGFMMCFASTSLGTIYHYVFGREAP